MPPQVLKLLLASTPDEKSQLQQHRDTAKNNPSQALMPGMDRLSSIVDLEEKGTVLESAGSQLDLTSKSRDLGALKRAVSSILSDAKRAVLDYQGAIAKSAARAKKEEEAKAKQVQKNMKAVAKQTAAAAPAPVPAPDFFAAAAASAKAINKISVKSTTVAKEAIVEACAPAQGLNAELPAVVALVEAATSLAKDQDFTAGFEAFKNDFKVSCEKAARAQRPRPGCTLGASALQAIAAAVQDLAPLGCEAAAGLPQLKEGTAAAQYQALERLLDPATIYITGMARGARYFGTDFCFLASVRWQLEGQRDVVLIPVAAVKEHLKGLQQWTQALPSPSAPSGSLASRDPAFHLGSRRGAPGAQFKVSFE